MLLSGFVGRQEQVIRQRWVQPIELAPNISVKRTAVPLRGPSAAHLGR